MRATPEVIAHRGASAHAPEHTLEAYDLALELGAQTLELDVRLTADGAPVLLHDPTLARTAGDPRAVAELAARDLGALRADVRPLGLGDVLRRYRTQVRFLVELKDPTPALEQAVLAAVARAAAADRVVLQSFDAAALRRLAPALPVALLQHVPPRACGAWLAGCAAHGLVGVGVHHAHVDAALVAAAHRCGLAVRAWTVNEPADAVRLAALGVDGIITDVPGRIRAAVAPLAPAGLAV